MSSGNWQQERKRNYELQERTVDNTYTVMTGTGTYHGRIDNPIKVDGSSQAFTLTVPSGAYIGQTLMISCQTAGNNVTVSVTNHANADAGTTTLDAADEALLLLWTGTEWTTLHYIGCSDIS